MNQKYVNSYYIRIFETFYDVNGNYWDGYVRLMWSPIEEYLFDLNEYTVGLKEKFRNKAEQRVKGIVGKDNFHHYECIEWEHGFIYRAYVYYQSEEETGGDEVFLYVKEGEHTVVEEYVVEFSKVVEDLVEMKELI